MSLLFSKETIRKEQIIQRDFLPAERGILFMFHDTKEVSKWLDIESFFRTITKEELTLSVTL